MPDLKTLSSLELVDFIEASRVAAGQALKELATRLQDGEQIVSSSGAPYWGERDEYSGEIYIIEEIPF